jgi:hypothetical protein
MLAPGCCGRAVGGGGMDVFADGYIPTLSQTLRFDSIVSNSFVLSVEISVAISESFSPRQLDEMLPSFDLYMNEGGREG